MRFRTWLYEASRRPPFTWPRKRKLRWLIALVAVVLAYPVLGTLAIWTGLVERLLHSEDLRVEIENPAYTIWPGRIRAKHVRILANGETQFILQGNDLGLSISVFPLFQRRVHVDRLAAHGVRYQMRVQVEDEKGIEKRLAAYPPLKDLPGAKVVKEKKAEQTEEREADWTVEVEGLDAYVEELWFFEYRYLGQGRIRGGFTVGPGVMQVKTAVQEIGPGDLYFGEKQLIARNVRGEVSADIPKVNPEEHADTSFFELVQSHVQLRADVETLGHVSAYLDGIAVSRGSGPFAADIYLDKGLLGSKSRIDFETDAVSLKGDGFAVDTDWKIDFDAAGEGKPSAEKPGGPKKDAGVRPLLRSSSKITYASLTKENRGFTVKIHGHEEEVALDDIQLSGSTKLKRASLRMPKIVSVDLKDLDAVLPEGTPVDVTAGEARASLSLDRPRRPQAERRRGRARRTNDARGSCLAQSEAQEQLARQRRAFSTKPGHARGRRES